MKDKAKQLIDDILKDLTDRGGLGDEWYQIDPEIQEEIKAEWTRMARQRMAEHAEECKE